jgi:hypothetical protein
MPLIVCKCGEELEFEGLNRNGDFVLRPCELCIERAEKVAADDAHSEGYDEGFEAGVASVEEKENA